MPRGEQLEHLRPTVAYPTKDSKEHTQTCKGICLRLTVAGMSLNYYAIGSADRQKEDRAEEIKTF